jgi:hypothetical protein
VLAQVVVDFEPVYAIDFDVENDLGLNVLLPHISDVRLTAGLLSARAERPTASTKATRRSSPCPPR